MHDYPSLPDFDSDLEELKKKFPNAEGDVRKALDEARDGRNRLYPIPLYRGLVKIRAGSTDQNKGKSGGFRVVYFNGTKGKCLVAVYAKSQCEDLPRAELNRLLKKARDRDESPS